MAVRKPWNRGGIRSWLLLLGLSAAWAGHATTLTLLCGTGLLLASMLMQFWSKGCLHQDQEVTRSGPYRFVRHPFYLGNFVLDGGIVLMSGYWLLILLWPLWWFIVYIPVMRSEEKTLIRLFGDEYVEYMARVPMLLPIRRPLSSEQDGAFSFACRNIMETEIPRATKYLVYPLLFTLAHRASAAGIGLVTSPTVTDLSLIALIVCLMSIRAAWMHRFRERA